MTWRFIAIGTSLGGFHALKTVLGALTKDFPLAVGVVQHRSNEDSEAFAPLLAAYSELPVIEVDDKEEIRSGCVYVCPSNYHLLVDGGHLALSTDEPVLHARPSIDVFFESAAETYRESVIGVLLTGMSKDGTAGLAKIKENGGFAIVQDPLAAEGRIMPETAIASVAIDKILPLEDIGPFLTGLCARTKGIEV
jgi:two-component system chemotaxis response regulator CheB